MTKAKCRQLLMQFDVFFTHRGYGEVRHNQEFDTAAAQRDWTDYGAGILKAFRALNPGGRVCWAECEFDGVALPSDQQGFHSLITKPIEAMFPIK